MVALNNVTTVRSEMMEPGKEEGVVGRLFLRAGGGKLPGKTATGHMIRILTSFIRAVVLHGDPSPSHRWLKIAWIAWSG